MNNDVRQTLLYRRAHIGLCEGRLAPVHENVQCFFHCSYLSTLCFPRLHRFRSVKVGKK